MENTFLPNCSYSPGEYGLPHMGEVIADYRRKKGWSQEDLATICEREKQSVAYWESQVFLKDMDRRILLCKLLKIPPVYLGLTWLSVANSNDILAVETLREVAERNIYALYEDFLVLARTSPNKYASDTTYRFYKHQKELEEIVNKAPELEKDSWVDLLCRYRYHATFIAQNHKQERKALRYANDAIELAANLDDPELSIGALYRRARIHLMQKNHSQARQDIEGALQRTKRGATGHKGETYLLTAEINGLYSGGDEKLQTQCRKWQDNALPLAYKEIDEDNGTRILFNLYAVHHEKAKYLLRLSFFHTSDQELADLLKNPYKRPDQELLMDAQNELLMARKQIALNGLIGSVYSMHFLLTDAKFSLISKNFEESSRRAKQALEIAQQKSSQQGVEEVSQLYFILHRLDPNNPCIINLGVALGLFPD